MKKGLLVIAILPVLLMTGCNKDHTTQNNEAQENQNNQQYIENTNSSGSSKEIVEVPTIEINGVKYKDINSIPTIESSFDDSLVYAATIKEGNDIYTKLSDSFIIQPDISSNTANENVSKRRIILPSKIYSSEENVSYLYNYNGEKYYIPTDKCTTGEEKIVYRDYGIELIKANAGIKINGITYSNAIYDWEYCDSFEDASLCETYMESWKISNRVLNSNSTFYIREGMDIFQVDFDDDPNTLEFIYGSGTLEEISCDTCPAYSLITYSEENGIKNYNDYGLRMREFCNISNYKNVFYGGCLFGIEENVITDYYIYDKDIGLVHVDRFANGLKLDENGFKELSKIALTMSERHTIKENEDGEKWIDFYTDIEYLLDENGKVITNEDGSWKENPNSKHIEAGTKIYINYIRKKGNYIGFKTEDGTEYEMGYYIT